MDAGFSILVFLELAGEDPRMGPSHISLFAALLYLSQKSGNPVMAYAAELRQLSKINSKRLYYQVMRDLKDGSYIRVKPSFNPAVRSEIYLRKLDREAVK